MRWIILRKIYDDMIVHWNTLRRYTDVAGENLIYNIRHMLHGYNVSQLQNLLEGRNSSFCGFCWAFFK